MTTRSLEPLFDLGRIVQTQGVAADFDPEYIYLVLLRHGSGDWGDLDDHDHQVNEAALRNGGRIMSNYETPQGRLWVITEGYGPEGKITTVLKPDEY